MGEICGFCEARPALAYHYLDNPSLQPEPAPGDGYTEEGCRWLLAGMLRQAIKDGREGDAKARWWVKGMGAAICDYFGLPPSALAEVTRGW
ncbi:MAG: hypothetical protein JW850_20275 [Thermoflexales bacterium]|nr:hypothetical protein [Thermoflexales bacterium]